MQWKKLLFYISSSLLVIVIFSLGLTVINIVRSAGNDVALRWSMIGAIGSWAGSIFGTIALVISLIALWLPQKVKIKVEITAGLLLTHNNSENDGNNAYIITVKNIGMSPVTINNIYLNFGGRDKEKIFIGLLNHDSFLQTYTPTFPKRLDQGESFDYYLLGDKLNAGIRHYEEKTPHSTPLYIVIDEVKTGNQFHKTSWTLEMFLEETAHE